MASAFDVADVIIQAMSQNDDDSLTNLKLNKLLYFAQGVCLARTERTLFDEPIEAWKLGPVVPAIYEKYKRFGKNPIVAPDVLPVHYEFSEEEFDAILDVLFEFGKYTGSALVSMTHKDDTPWAKTFYSTSNASSTQIPQQISLESMKKYFADTPVAHFGEKIKAPIVTSLPNDWYDPSEDAHWESYL